MANPSAPSSSGYYLAGPIDRVRAIAHALDARGHDADALIDMGGHSIEVAVGDAVVLAYDAADADPDRAGYYALLVHLDREAVYYGDAPALVVEVEVGVDADPLAVAAALDPAIGTAVAFALASTATA